LPSRRGENAYRNVDLTLGQWATASPAPFARQFSSQHIIYFRRWRFFPILGISTLPTTAFSDILLESKVLVIGVEIDPVLEF
jgi:hypothetical protein